MADRRARELVEQMVTRGKSKKQAAALSDSSEEEDGGSSDSLTESPTAKRDALMEDSDEESDGTLTAALSKTARKKPTPRVVEVHVRGDLRKKGKEYLSNARAAVKAIVPADYDYEDGLTVKEMAKICGLDIDKLGARGVNIVAAGLANTLTSNVVEKPFALTDVTCHKVCSYQEFGSGKQRAFVLSVMMAPKAIRAMLLAPRARAGAASVKRRKRAVVDDDDDDGEESSPPPRPTKKRGGGAARRGGGDAEGGDRRGRGRRDASDDETQPFYAPDDDDGGPQPIEIDDSDNEDDDLAALTKKPGSAHAKRKEDRVKSTDAMSRELSLASQLKGLNALLVRDCGGKGLLQSDCEWLAKKLVGSDESWPPGFDDFVDYHNGDLVVNRDDFAKFLRGPSGKDWSFLPGGGLSDMSSAGGGGGGDKFAKFAKALGSSLATGIGEALSRGSSRPPSPALGAAPAAALAAAPAAGPSKVRRVSDDPEMERFVELLLGSMADRELAVKIKVAVDELDTPRSLLKEISRLYAKRDSNMTSDLASTLAETATLLATQSKI